MSCLPAHRRSVAKRWAKPARYATQPGLAWAWPGHDRQRRRGSVLQRTADARQPLAPVRTAPRVAMADFRCQVAVRSELLRAASTVRPWRSQTERHRKPGWIAPGGRRLDRSAHPGPGVATGPMSGGRHLTRGARLRAQAAQQRLSTPARVGHAPQPAPPQRHAPEWGVRQRARRAVQQCARPAAAAATTGRPRSPTSARRMQAGPQRRRGAELRPSWPSIGTAD